MIHNFIFDIDGTLVDSNDLHTRAWERAFATSGKKVAFQEIRRQMGKGGDHLLPLFLSAEELKASGKAIADRSGEIFKREYLIEVRPFPKVRELFKAIRGAGARIVLASSAKEEEVKQYEVIAQISDLVEESASSDDADSSKPSPNIFHAAMARLGNPGKESVLVVGDTPYDAIAAKKAELSAIGVLCGGFSESELRSAGCRCVYRDPADILQQLKTILRG